MKYVGLTDDPAWRRQKHGNPRDWQQHLFSAEMEARLWESSLLAQSSYTGGTGGEGWRYGYTYTITPDTVQ